MKAFIQSDIEGKKIGLGIKVARKRRGLSRNDLSFNSKVSPTAIQRIENGDLTVGMGKVLNILEALGLLTGLSDLVNPENDREQALKEIKELREAAGSKERRKEGKSKLARFI